MHFNILSLTGLAVLYLTPVVSSYAIASPVTQASVPDDDKSLKTLEDAFEAIDSIPDSVLEAGDEAKDKWVQEHYRSKGDKTGQLGETNGDGLEKRLDIKEIAECAYELATNVPAGKLLKLKKVVDALGGWKNAAKKLLEARRNPKSIGKTLQELIDIIIGIKGIKKECWDDFQ